MSQNYQMSTADKLFGQTALSSGQSVVIRQTYAFLTLSVITAMVGGYIGSNSLPLIRFLSSPVGWIVSLLTLNVVPILALRMRHNPTLGTAALMLDGFVAGIVLGPILAYASKFAPDIILTAFLITAIVFMSITGFVMSSKRTFSAPKGLMVGIFFSLIAITGMNFFFQLSILTTLISLGIGILGVFTLVYATSDVLNNPEADSPIPGALMLFAGIFNVFYATLMLLLSFSGRD